jgi:hypothetical protein
MIEPLAGKPQTGVNVLRFKVRQFFKHLHCRQAVGEEVEDIGHADPHATNAGTPSTLFWIYGDPFR